MNPITPIRNSPRLSDILRTEVDAARVTPLQLSDAFDCSLTTAYEMLAGTHDKRFSRINHAVRILAPDSSRAVVSTLLIGSRWQVQQSPESIVTDLNGDGRTDSRDLMRAVVKTGAEYQAALERCMESGTGMVSADCADALARRLEEIEAAVQVAKAILPKITMRRS